MSLCTGCGMSLDDGARFCTNCGIRVQAAASPAPLDPAPSSPAAATAPAMAEVRVPTITPALETTIAPSSGVAPIVVVICAVLILLIGAAVSATLYLQNQRRPKVAAENAAATAQPASPEDNYIRALKLGNYPGATPVAIVTLNGETVVVGFVTRDRPDQVMQFYKVRFPISDVTSDNVGSHLSVTLPNNQRIRIDAEPQGEATQVKIVRVP